MTIAGNNIDEMARVIHVISTEKGFAPPDLTNLPEKLMLSVSELAEALEEHRSGHPLLWFKYTGHATAGMEFRVSGAELGKLTHQDMIDLGYDAKPEGILVEIADSIIRNLHMMHSIMASSEEEGVMGTTISDVINLKVNYNAGRPAMHGRKY